MVEGVEHTPNNALLQALALQKGSSLVGFSTAGARERLESLSWVREAVVNRSLPSTIKVEIFEHKPVARLLENSEDGGQDVWIINTEGARIAIDSAGEFASLPIIQGLGAEKEAAGLVTLIKETGFYNKVVTAVYVGERRWNLGFAGDMWVQLPENDALNALAILEQLEKRQKVLQKAGAMVDLRLDDRIIFRMPPKNKVSQRVL
jgi:cell division protein FtsQ